jgi:serine/threonine-protein kinase
MQKAQQLGRYQLLDRIAFGGMAEIYRAKTFDLEGREHLVAVKRVLQHLTTDEEFMKMIVDEAKLTALIAHENIARVYEFAHAGDEYFIAMEYVDGKDVRAILERHRQKGTSIPPEHVAWIIMETAHALNAAHTQRDKQGRAMHIVHRDVSPSNVLCSYNGEVKLCDFGIAKATLTRTQTKTGVIKGKVKYMSPEQAMGRKLDHRSDLFSLGTVMYEMLTLEAPFQAPTEVELIFCVRDAQKRDARQLVPSLPSELNDILNRMMSRSRSQRYQSGEECALALRVFLDKFRPGYRRSNFGRFMRREFQEDIEKELRQLEEFVIAGGDPTKVGENLIADALGPDAIYTKFTAAHPSTDGTPAGTTGNRGEPDSLPPPPELHVQPTRILDLPRAPSPSRNSTDLHALETRILTMPKPSQIGFGDAANAEESTTAERKKKKPSPEDPLHEMSTRILSMPKEEESLHEQGTKILTLPDEPGPLHQMETRILSLPGGVRPQLRRDGPGSGTPKVVVDVDPEKHAGDDEQTTVPLLDDDLEEA